MANNTHLYGFRWSSSNGVPHPKPLLMPVASGANFTVSGDATNLNLNVGDVVTRLTSGFVSLCGGNENSQTSVAVFGVVVGMGPAGFFNGTRMVRQNFLQSGCTYGTNIERISQVFVVPAATGGFWEIDVDDNTTATTLLTYQALVGENADHRNTPNDTLLQANPLLNIASHGTSAALSCRIEGISTNFANQDYSGTFVKMLIRFNKGQEPEYLLTGLA